MYNFAGITCGLVQTFGVNALPVEEQSKTREKIKLLNDFNKENDPYGEHDFGAIVHNGEKIYWKIDYYDTDLKYGSKDPADMIENFLIRNLSPSSGPEKEDFQSRSVDFSVSETLRIDNTTALPYN
ncbi:MAG: DUF3768 domain-containing protein [Candidatus Scalindua sp.]|nr:DUF3768 domain-containing protein [Candidatus Scalindua sp.]